jgi:hypothetical protein
MKIINKIRKKYQFINELILKIDRVIQNALRRFKR